MSGFSFKSDRERILRLELEFRKLLEKSKSHTAQLQAIEDAICGEEEPDESVTLSYKDVWALMTQDLSVLPVDQIVRVAQVDREVKEWVKANLQDKEKTNA